MKQLNNALQIFLTLPMEKQEAIESKILKKRKEINPQIKKISTFLFHKMIASDIEILLAREKLI